MKRLIAPQFIRSSTRVVLVIACALLCSGMPAATKAEAGPPAAADMKSLDEQVQEVKTDVLAIAAELRNLEEKLIYPSNTQVAVFVSMKTAGGDSSASAESGEELQSVPIDAARISIDGEPVSQHLYSFKELQALARGGVQRIYTGNLRTGKHLLEVEISGSTRAGETASQTHSLEFEKAVDPKSLGIVLRGESASSMQIEIEDW